MSDLAAVRPLRPADAGRVAELHLLAFPDYESSRLGRGYCRRLVLAYADRPDAWVLVAGRGEAIDGFLVGAPPSAQREVNAALLVAQMLAIGRVSGAGTRILVASLRDTGQLVRLAAAGQDCFTLAPTVARALMFDANTLAAAADFEQAALPRASKAKTP